MKSMKQTQKIEYKRVLIYCRVSSDRQVNEGHGLDSQEQRCISYATNKGLEVAKVFREEGISGKLFDRPAMQRLIQYLDDHSKERFVIIFDDLARFSRDVPVHLLLKTELVIQREAKLECLNFNFEDSPTGRYIELIMVGAGQLQREQNTEQVKNKMKARAEAGFWPFCPPPGLSNQKDPIKGKILKPLYPLADIYKEAIEQFRDYKLNTLEAVQEFILSKYKVHGINKPLSLGGTDRILKQLLYTGYLEYEPWDVSRRIGQHEGFISYETYLAVQDKLANKAKPRLRKDYSIDFPVRGYALCSDCKRPMTAGWFKGNGSERFPKYLCKTTNCDKKNKTISRESLEGSFEELLKTVTPQKGALKFIEAVVMDAWKTRMEKEQVTLSLTNQSVELLEGKNSSLMSRIIQSNNDTLVLEYEKAIALNLTEIKKLKEKSTKIKYPQKGFQTALEVVLDFMDCPLKQWQSKDYKRQRLLLSMYFEQKLVYDANLGFQTVELPLILELSSQLMYKKTHLVDIVQNSLNPIYEWVMRSYALIQTLQDTSNTALSQHLGSHT
jgi:site-specific DNA recombinase